MAAPSDKRRFSGFRSQSFRRLSFSLTSSSSSKSFCPRSPRRVTGATDSSLSLPESGTTRNKLSPPRSSTPSSTGTTSRASHRSSSNVSGSLLLNVEEEQTQNQQQQQPTTTTGSAWSSSSLPQANKDVVDPMKQSKLSMSEDYPSFYSSSLVSLCDSALNPDFTVSLQSPLESNSDSSSTLVASTNNIEAHQYDANPVSAAEIQTSASSATKNSAPAANPIRIKRSSTVASRLKSARSLVSLRSFSFGSGSSPIAPQFTQDNDDMSQITGLGITSNNNNNNHHHRRPSFKSFRAKSFGGQEHLSPKSSSPDLSSFQQPQQQQQQQQQFHIGQVSPTIPQTNSEAHTVRRQKSRLSLSSFADLGLGHKGDLRTSDHSVSTRVSPQIGHRSKSFFNLQDPGLVLHHGEVITGINLLRSKKKEYLVLTETQLQRYKNRTKSAEVFPYLDICPPPSPSPALSQSTDDRPSSAFGTHWQQVTDYQSNYICELRNLVSVVDISPVNIELWYSVEEDDGFHSFPIYKSMVIQLANHSEMDEWLQIFHEVGSARAQVRQRLNPDINRQMIASLIKLNDFHNLSFATFRAIYYPHRIKCQSDDIAKLTPIPCYVVIGFHYLHIISAVQDNDRAPVVLASHGLLAISKMSMLPKSSGLDIHFKVPFQASYVVHVSSFAAPEIADAVRRASGLLRPCWQHTSVPIDFGGHIERPEPSRPTETILLELFGFERTLSAYCSAYGVDASNIRYAIDYNSSHGTSFHLMAPKCAPLYSCSELVALLRSLRWNDLLNCISFSGVYLDNLLHLIDPFDETKSINDLQRETSPSRSPRSNKTSSVDVSRKTVLKCELKTLFSSCRNLIRLDFSNCLCPHPGQLILEENSSRVGVPEGHELTEALMGVCSKGPTSITSVAFSGLPFDSLDVDFLISILESKNIALSALELANCLLYERELGLVLRALDAQCYNLTALDLSDNPGRMSAKAIDDTLSRLINLRSLKFQSIRTALEDSPFFSVETLMGWQGLQELVLDKTAISPSTVSALCSYFSACQSTELLYVSVQGCRLTGTQVGEIMKALATNPHRAPDTLFSAGGNFISDGFGDFLDQIGNENCISRLALSKVEFKQEKYLTQLLAAMVDNETITHLDLSFLLVPDDAGEDTCKMLGEVFGKNKSLISFNLMGETSKLQTSMIGQGLISALPQLKSNTTLKCLKLKGNKLGSGGIKEIANVLRENQTLEELWIDDNLIDLDCFLYLLSALESRNSKLQFLDFPVNDCEMELRKLKQMLRQACYRNNVCAKPRSPAASDRASMLQTINKIKKSLEDTMTGWDKSKVRLQDRLYVNYLSCTPDRTPILYEEESDSSLTDSVSSHQSLGMVVESDREHVRSGSDVSESLKIVATNDEYASSNMKVPCHIVSVSNLDRPLSNDISFNAKLTV